MLVCHTVRIKVAEDVPSLVLQVYDVGGIEFGTIESSPYDSWTQIACTWQRETGTILLLPEGVHLHTIAAELHDDILTAVVLVSAEWPPDILCTPFRP